VPSSSWRAPVCGSIRLALVQAGEDEWCWPEQAADALRAMKHLADEALARDGTLTSLNRERRSTITRPSVK
jgi:hypothetical protein